jgi:CheY-like chemotaxis protein
MADLDKQIVVVDDDQGILESFDAILGDDYYLVTIDNGLEAIEYVRSHKPKLIFLDVKMPEISGIEILRRLRHEKIDSAVVIVTATPQHHIETESEQLGITAYLHKPLEVDEIEDITRRVLH